MNHEEGVLQGGLAHPALLAAVLLVLGGGVVEEVEGGAPALGTLEVVRREHDVHEAPLAAGEHHGRRHLCAHRGHHPQLGLRRRRRRRQT